MALRFDEYEFDPDGSGLTRHGEAVAIEPQALRLLELLLDHRDRIVSKDELIDRIWDGRAISDAALSTRIRSLRRALGDDAAQQRFIKTFPKRGFQFVGELKEIAPASGKVRTALPFRSVIASLAVVSVILLVAIVEREIRPRAEIEKPSIAVMPFENLDPEGADGYFANGLTEDLTRHLARYRELFVISSATVFSYSEEDVAPFDIARDLSVSYGLRGSVRRENDRVRVSAELVNIEDGNTIWSERFDRDLTAIFDMQDEISQAIAGQLVPEIMQSGSARLSGVPTADMGAWDLYIRARQEQSNLTSDSQHEALWLARLAATADPDFAAAYSVQALALGALFFFGWAEDPEATLTQATAAAKRAIELDPRDPGALATLGYIYRFTGDAERAIENLELAVRLNPNDARSRLQLAHTLDWFRLQERALPEIEMAIKLSPRDPLLANMFFYKGHILFHLKQYEASLETARQLQAVATNNTWLVFYHLLRAANLSQMARAEDALEAIDAALEINPKLSLSAMRRQFAGSKNHPENRRIWLASLEKAGLPEKGPGEIVKD